MENIFIVWGVIVVVSLVTGITLIINEKKRKKREALTDDPRILFEDNLENFNLSFKGSSVSDDDGIFDGEEANTIHNEDSSFQNDTDVDKNKNIADNLFDEEII